MEILNKIVHDSVNWDVVLQKQFPNFLIALIKCYDVEKSEVKHAFYRHYHNDDYDDKTFEEFSEKDAKKMFDIEVTKLENVYLAKDYTYDTQWLTLNHEYRILKRFEEAFLDAKGVRVTIANETFVPDTLRKRVDDLRSDLMMRIMQIIAFGDVSKQVSIEKQKET